MTHPLANDPSTPDILKRAFARVHWQVVAVLSDGNEAVINCTTQTKVDEAVARFADIRRAHDERGYGFRDGTTITDVSVRAI